METKNKVIRYVSTSLRDFQGNCGGMENLKCVIKKINEDNNGWFKHKEGFFRCQNDSKFKID